METRRLAVVKGVITRHGPITRDYTGDGRTFCGESFPRITVGEIYSRRRAVIKKDAPAPCVNTAEQLHLD